MLVADYTASVCEFSNLSGVAGLISIILVSFVAACRSSERGTFIPVPEFERLSIGIGTTQVRS